MVKQTIMTTVYGVTKFGAKAQIGKQLVNQDGFDSSDVGPGSMYLANKTFESLNELFESSQTIQNWLTECSNIICHNFGKCVEWETPLGLLVVQPYLKEDCKTNVTKSRVS